MGSGGSGSGKVKELEAALAQLRKTQALEAALAQLEREGAGILAAGIRELVQAGAMPVHRALVATGVPAARVRARRQSEAAVNRRRVPPEPARPTVPALELEFHVLYHLTARLVSDLAGGREVNLDELIDQLRRLQPTFDACTAACSQPKDPDA
jgi:hypothetical protein